MTTIRRRLTLWYTVALAVTVLAFGTALYLERRQSGIKELDQRLSLEADLAHRWLTESYKVLGRIVTTSGSNPALDPGISAYLESVRDYLVVADTAGQVLALSEVTRTLSADALERLTAPLDTAASRDTRDARPGPAQWPGALPRGSDPGRRTDHRWPPRGHPHTAGGVGSRRSPALDAADRAGHPGGRRAGRLLAGRHQPASGAGNHG